MVVLLTALAACSSGGSDSADKPSGGASASSAPPAPAPPAGGSCHALSFDAGGPAGRLERPRPVRAAAHDADVQGRHPGRPLRRPPARGRLPRRPGQAGEDLPDGTAGATSAATRPPSGSAGSRSCGSARRWSRPTPAPTGTAATSSGCARSNSLISLPRTMKGALDAPDALDRFGTCGTAAPDAPVFERVVCADKHSWRAVDVVDLPTVDALPRPRTPRPPATPPARTSPRSEPTAPSSTPGPSSGPPRRAVGGRSAVRVLLGAGGGLTAPGDPVRPGVRRRAAVGNCTAPRSQPGAGHR